MYIYIGDSLGKSEDPDKSMGFTGSYKGHGVTISLYMCIGVGRVKFLVLLTVSLTLERASYLCKISILVCVFIYPGINHMSSDYNLRTAVKLRSPTGSTTSSWSQLDLRKATEMVERLVSKLIYILRI